MDTENKYGTYAVQKDLLFMIKDIHKFCVKHKINYSLCGGSLLGAVRQNGFIPWDDDMDICFTRKNYEKFKNAFKDNREYDIIQDIWVPRITRKEKSPNNTCVDIFIFDNVPSNELVSKLKVFMIKTLQGMMKKADLCNKKYNFTDKVLLLATMILGKLFCPNFKKKLYSQVSKIGNKQKSDFINAYNDLYKLIELKYPVEIIKLYTLIPFEDTIVYAMVGYDKYLTLQYGDYMTPPDEKDRIPQHLKCTKQKEEVS